MLVLDKFKLLLSSLVVVATVGSFIYLGATPLVLKLLAMLAGFSLALLIAWTSEPGKRFFAYTQDSVAETRKVVWPTKKETLQTTGLVVLFVLVMAVFLWLVDGLLVVVVRFLLGTGG